MLLLAWLLVRMFWLILLGPEVEPDPVPPLPQIQASQAARDGFRWDLFGASTALRPVAVAVPVASRSELRLRGVMSGGAAAFAIIADAQGTEAVFRIGDGLPDGSTLTAIEPLQVIVERTGQREALSLDRDAPSAAASASSAPRRDVAATSMPGIRGFQAPAGISAASLQVPASPPAALADQIAILPVAGGGFRVRPGRDASLFAELGLQVNDVVMAVNGQPLSSEADARALFADVLRQGEVSITINRQGREVTLRPDLERILSRL